jgi:hypothetical protein
MDPVADAFSPQIYGNYPVLDSILLHYLDIESIVARHQVNPAAFETQEALCFLAQSFDLPPSTTFPAFLARYDTKYATVRSYLLPSANPKAIMLKAAEAGELQAFYLGLRRNPKYKTPTFLDPALKLASRGDNQVMIDLIKDLGGTSFYEEVRGMAQGGHLEKLKPLITKTPGLTQCLLYRLVKDAVRYGQLATAKYLTTRWHFISFDWDDLIPSADNTGNQGMIDYVISQGGKDYTEVILRAISDGHLERAKQYMDKPGLNYLYIFRQAFYSDYLELAKLVARDRRIDQDVLNDLMSRVTKTTTYETIDYLISLGGNNYKGLVNQLVMNDQIELFKRYCPWPGADYLDTFQEGLKSSSLKVVKFMLEQELIPVTETWLNEYLDLVVFNPKLIALLFRLGATDYPGLVERALIQGELKLAKKYFDRAPTIRLNSLFKQCTSVPVYEYIISQGTITQTTLDATLARMKEYKYVEAEKYLRSLGAKESFFSILSSIVYPYLF